MRFKRYAPRPYVKVQPLKLTPDPRGSSFGNIYVADGPTFEAHVRKLDSAERFEYGGTITKIAVRVTADLPMRLTEKNRFALPGEPTGTSTSGWNITNVVPYAPRGIVTLDAERTY